MPQSRPDGKGGWIRGTGGAHKGALYHLPQLLAAPPDEPVVVVEGEAKVEALEKLGVLATCNAGGAGKWTREHARQLGGHPVIVLPDNDPQGHAHAGRSSPRGPTPAPSSCRACPTRATSSTG
jgi:hypothetical protein